MTPTYTMTDVPEVTQVIWPAFKPTLQEKHGTSGEKGARGEDNALLHLTNKEYFPDFKLVVKHEDSMHQLMGVDFTCFGNDGGHFIDAKSGSSSLYWTKDLGWYVTFRSDWFANPHKKTEYFMHLGPKGDIFAIYHVGSLGHWRKNNLDKFKEGKYGPILLKKYWEDATIYTNLK